MKRRTQNGGAPGRYTPPRRVSARAAESTVERGFRLTGQFLNFLMIALTIAAGYFMTIESLKVELSGKAEKEAVNTLDKKLGNLEVLFKEGAITREEFFKFSTEVYSRLGRIEDHLNDQTGDSRERKQ
jgi:hypothetical protein